MIRKFSKIALTLAVCVFSVVSHSACAVSKGPLSTAFKKIQANKQPLATVFDDAQLGYSIRYPFDWIFERPGKFQLVFSGKPGTKAYFSTVSIQNLASVKQGGVQDSLDSVKKTYIRQLKNPVEGIKTEVKISEERPFPYSKEGRPVLRGVQFIAEFSTVNKESLKQLTVILERSGKEAYYVWTYVAPVAQFEEHLKIARQMLDSWDIK